MANYYIADLHLGHANIIKFDNRPFGDLRQMHRTIIDNWNTAVKANDTVYILGDFAFAKEPEWPFLLNPLAGNKVLIVGNHDPKQFSRETRKCFADVQRLLEINDGNRHVIMCHYPMPFHRCAYSNQFWMLYGHVHSTREYDMMEDLRKKVKASCRERGDNVGNWINVGCMMPWINYTPRTLDEIIAGDAKNGGYQIDGGKKNEI